tara:strand:- start:940 stop:1191 length:252 start_codon:yes stop_codon:yes gene_type:complete
MPRHKILKNRINKEAERLGEFTTSDLMDILNNYPNNHGYGTTHLTVNSQRLSNLLYANPKIGIKQKYTTSKSRTIWEWMGDEE